MKLWKIVFSILTGVSLSTSINASAACIDNAKFNCYHRPGYGIAVSTDSLGLARYTEAHEYTYGLAISPYTRITGSSNTSKIGARIFARKNFPVLDQLVTGVGLALGKNFGREDGKTIKNSFFAYPYVIFEYAATPNVLLGASINIVRYETQKLGNTTTREWRVLRGSSLQLTYLFA